MKRIRNVISEEVFNKICLVQRIQFGYQKIATRGEYRDDSC